MLKGVGGGVTAAGRATQLLKYAPTLTLYGDSRTAGTLTDIPSSIPNQVTSDRWARWACAFSGGRLKILFDGGIVGNTSQDVLGRMIANGNANPAGYITLMMAANDPNSQGQAQGLTPTKTIANITAAAALARAWGSMPILFTESPQSTSGNSGVGQNANYLFLVNAGIRSLAAANNYLLVDVWPINIDASTTTGAARLNYMVDSLHFCENSGFAIGQAMWAVINSSNTLTPDGLPHISTMSDTPGANAGTRQVLPNPLFYGNTGGFFGTGAVAQPWVTLTAYLINVYRTNAGNVYRVTTAGTTGATGPTGTGTAITDGTVTWTYVCAAGTAQAPDVWLTGPTVGSGSSQVFTLPRADGDGTDLYILCTSVAFGNVFEINSNGFQANLARGDAISSQIFVSQIQASGLYEISFEHSASITGDATYSQKVYASGFDAGFYNSSPFTDLCFTPQPLLIPNTGSALSTTLCHIQIKFSAAGYAVIKVAKAQVLH